MNYTRLFWEYFGKQQPKTSAGEHPAGGGGLALLGFILSSSLSVSFLLSFLPSFLPSFLFGSASLGLPSSPRSLSSSLPPARLIKEGLSSDLWCMFSGDAYA